MSTQHPSSTSPKRLAIGALGALGVVYGDIGTSPLYAVRECFHGAHGMTLDHTNVGDGIIALPHIAAHPAILRAAWPGRARSPTTSAFS